MANLNIKNKTNNFGDTGGAGNTTSYANSDVFLVSNTAVSSDITDTNQGAYSTEANTPYPTILLREGSYGFPKYPQGNFKDSIYSMLDFQKFSIGTIGGLTGIDPGQEYNIDPYVLSYQPYIAAFDRKDYIIEIDSPTKDFINGEKINQSSDNLILYDLQVSGGVYGNTYSEKSSFIDSKIDIDDSIEFIYSPAGISSIFDANTGVDGAENLILINDNSYDLNDVIRYTTDTGNTAISGLTNNEIYYVISANSTGIKVSSTLSGSEVDITASSISEAGHRIKKYSNPFLDDDKILYRSLEDSAISGLSNNEIYYIVNSNTVGFSLSSTLAGAAIDITANSVAGEGHFISSVSGYLPNDKVFSTVSESFDSSSDVIDGNDSIQIADNPFELGSSLTYTTDTGNTAISGLTNNEIYYVESSNSTAITLSDTLGGSVIDLVPSGASETGHNLIMTANAQISSVFTEGANSFVRVSSVENNFAANNQLFSYTNPNVDEIIQGIEFDSITSVAQGIIKPDSNTTHLKVKRINFETTFKAGFDIIGDSSGASANVISIIEDEKSVPIGLNASIDANVITAEGQVVSLQVIDSGFGYVNSEIVEFTASDGINAGSAKIVLDGSGVGKGFYKSTKGFLSSDMYVQDGDYYQEYSYEVLSKISFDKYSDVFKSVMHTAGTKFFGSILSIEEVNIEMDVDSIEKRIEISFNASTGVDSIDDTIDVQSSGVFVNGDIIEYRTEEGNTAISGLSNNGIYEVANTQGNLIQLFSNGIINISSGSLETGHVLIKIEGDN